MNAIATSRRRGATPLDIVIRSVRADDKAHLCALFSKLSGESRRRRFLRVKNGLEEHELVALTELDPSVAEALVAFDATTSEAVGVARYVRRGTRGTTADVAIAVADSHQGRGVGTALVARLTDRALLAGVGWFTALSFYDNRAARRVLEHAGPARVTDRQVDVVELEIPLK